MGSSTKDSLWVRHGTGTRIRSRPPFPILVNEERVGSKRRSQKVNMKVNMKADGVRRKVKCVGPTPYSMVVDGFTNAG